MQESLRHKKPTVDSTYIRPERANSLMKKAHSIRQTVYIYGSTGFGKTSLAASFFAHRRYEYYSMNSEDITDFKHAAQKESAAKERIVVVDDLYRLVSEDEREMCRKTLEKLAEDKNVWLILISRAPIPAWLQPLYIKNVFVVIDEDDLRLSESEEADYINGWELSLLPETEKQLRAKGNGQPLFLRIAAMRINSVSGGGRDIAERSRIESAALRSAEEEWCSYIDIHVYDQWDIELQEFLTDISIVDSFNVQTAQLITKKNNISELVLRSKETGNFLTEHIGTGAVDDLDGTVFELRRQMRTSMRRRLQKRYPQGHINSLYYSAGSIYEVQGRFSQALVMYEKCGDNESISRILIENARNHAGSGHYWELKRYYLSLPDDIIRQSPELMAGMSLLQSIIVNDDESERWYEELQKYAKVQTGTAKKTATARLLYLDICLPQRGISNISDALKRSWKFMTERKIILPELSLTNNQPTLMHGGKDFCEWSKRDRELARTIGKPVELLLGNFGKGLVNLALAESFFEKGGDNYEISTLALKGRMQAMSGGKAENVFVGTGILAWLSVFNNCIDDALESLASFRETAKTDAPSLLGGIDTLKMRFMLYIGRSAEVAEWLKTAPDENAEFCTLERYRYIGKARVYLSLGKREKAAALLEQLLIYAEKRNRTYLLIEAKTLLAIAQFRMKSDLWRKTLREAVALAEEYHFVRVLSREGKPLLDLLRADKTVFSDKEFQKQVVAECEHIALMYPSYLNEKHESNVVLSDKALKILRLQADGKTMGEIALALGLSKEGVRYYNRETYKKLGANSKTTALQAARNMGII